jgi:GAF domain-containing protein
MRRRDKAGGKTARRRRKASKRQNGLKVRNRDETLEQLAVTSEVLEAISHSTFDLQTVLATLVKSAGRLCQAENVQIFLYDGEFYRLAADNGFSLEYQQYARDHPIRPGRDTVVARTALGIEPVQIPDALADPEYTYGGQKLGGYRTLLGVPLLRDEKCIGVIALTRSKIHPFTDRQITLVTNFAAQAVIAIENTRLLKELRERTEQLEAQSREVAKLNQQLEQRVADQVGEIERMGRLRRFLPPQVADLIVASGTEKQLESHRREITALFCDLRGFTGSGRPSALPAVSAFSAPLKRIGLTDQR